MKVKDKNFLRPLKFAPFLFFGREILFFGFGGKIVIGEFRYRYKKKRESDDSSSDDSDDDDDMDDGNFKIRNFDIDY